MVVTLEQLPEVTYVLQRMERMGLDCETTGLRSFHGDRIFSLALVGDVEGARHRFYFNFWEYPDLDSKFVLDKGVVFSYLQEYLFGDESRIYFAHNARFDLHMLHQEGVEIKGIVHCTQAMGRVTYNQHDDYSLEASLERIGCAKDPAVEDYITEHGLWEHAIIPGRKQRGKNKFYYKVPFKIIMPYALKDSEGALVLGMDQEREIAELDNQIPEYMPKLAQVMNNERALTKTLVQVERNGCKIDRRYSEEAVTFFDVAMDLSRERIEEATGMEFKDSGKFLAYAFKGQEKNFTYTEKGKLSFDKDALKKIDHPLVQPLLEYRAAKNRLGFFQGFLYHADSNDIVHPSFNPDRAQHGRFSSSNPNFQNLKRNDASEDEEEAQNEIYVRRAIIPRAPDRVLLAPDYIGMEYAMALEYACIIAGRMVPLAQMVRDGLKFHNATVELVKKIAGYDLEYTKAKVANFLSLYEGGPAALAESIECPIEEAREIQSAIGRACPELLAARQYMIQTAKRRGFVINWFGRRCWFPISRFAYRGPNHIISGGCADVMKKAMVDTQRWLEGERLSSLMIMTVHDELVLDCPKTEAFDVAKQVAHYMESAFPYKYVPMKADMQWAERSLADKMKGFPSHGSLGEQGTNQ